MRNLTKKEEQDICEQYRNGMLASEIAVEKGYTFFRVIGVLIRNKQVDPLEYRDATMMPLEWIEEWLQIWQSKGRVRKGIERGERMI